MANLLFDTCVFIDFLRGDLGARGALARALAVGATDHGFYSTWTMLELLQKSDLMPDQQARRLAVVDHLTPIPMSLEIARDAGLLASDLRNGSPRTILGDAVIAMSAASVSAAVVTRNVAEFSLLKVALQTY